MEPYNNNKPFISMKLDGSLLDKMVEAGIPLTRALQYFRDNPEGQATETISLAAEDRIPFYSNIINDGDAEDYVKEAIMLAMPMRASNGRYKVDTKRTNEINRRLKYYPYDYLAKKEPLTFSQYEDLKSRRNWAPDDFKVLEPVWDDIIVAEGKVNPLYYKVTYPQIQLTNGYKLSNAGNDPKYPHLADSELISERYNPNHIYSNYTGYVDNNYNFTAGELDKALVSKRTPQNLYIKDFGDLSPYSDYGKYSKDLINRGITEEERIQLLNLGKEYENILLDATIEPEVKAGKLDMIKRQMEIIESLSELNK